MNKVSYNYKIRKEYSSKQKETLEKQQKTINNKQ